MGNMHSPCHKEDRELAKEEVTAAIAHFMGDDALSMSAEDLKLYILSECHMGLRRNYVDFGKN